MKLHFIQISAAANEIYGHQLYGLTNAGVVYRYVHRDESSSGKAFWSMLTQWTPDNKGDTNNPGEPSDI